jgi:hypothetical protein
MLRVIFIFSEALRIDDCIGMEIQIGGVYSKLGFLFAALALIDLMVPFLAYLLVY